MAKYTSAEAAKLLRELREKHHLLLVKEGNAKTFRASIGEDPESLRPVYDYEETQRQLAAVEEKIRLVRHAINLFNITTEVEGMTIDEVLVCLPQLKERREKLSKMIGRLPRQRVQPEMMHFGRGSSIIDYDYVNYDIEKAERDFRDVSVSIGRLQAALDLANSTRTLEIDISVD